MAHSSTMVYSKNNQLQNSVRGILRLWLILELIVYWISKMVKDRQGNGKLLHNGENGLIAIYFFAIERRCGNGELFNNSQFLCERATVSPTFYWLLSVQAFCVYGWFLDWLCYRLARWLIPKIYVFVIEQWRGTGKLLNDGLFQKQPTPEFS